MGCVCENQSSKCFLTDIVYGNAEQSEAFLHGDNPTQFLHTFQIFFSATITKLLFAD